MPEHVGKGAFCLQQVAHLQAKDPEFICLWTDAENAFDEDWAVKLGVDLDRLFIQRYTRDTNSMERLMDAGLNFVKNLKPGMWIIDSIGALLPKNDGYETKGTKVEDKSLEGHNMLNLQRKLGEFYRKANIYISPSKTDDYKGCATILIGQIYSVPSPHATINEVKGGNAVKHWAHLRLMFRRGPRADWPQPVEAIGPSGNKIKFYPGWSGRIKVEKTRINANEGKEVLLPFYHSRGFNSKESTIYSALGLNLIERSGPTYKHEALPDGKLVGKEAVITYFLENEEAYQALHEQVTNATLDDISEEDIIEKTEIDIDPDE